MAILDQTDNRRDHLLLRAAESSHTYENATPVANGRRLLLQASENPFAASSSEQEAYACGGDALQSS